MPYFTKTNVIYIPVYNCTATIVDVVKSIPSSLREQAQVVIVDNCSPDGTFDYIQQKMKDGVLPSDLIVLQTPENCGYAGSQKFMYSQLTKWPWVERVAMLHGDGQYPGSELTKFFDPSLAQFDVIYGYRTKGLPGEETPWSTYFIIKLLSLMESLVTGVFRREWHSGMVAYSARFLKRVDFDQVTKTPHIDGNLLFVSSHKEFKVTSVPIVKKYRELTAFEGHERRKYVMNVFKHMWEFRTRGTNHYLKAALVPSETTASPSAEKSW